MHEHRRQVMADLGERFGSAAAHEEPLAVDDVEALVHAAQKGQIETLLVDPVAPPSAQVWVSGDGQILGRHEEDVVALGGTDPHRVDAADALIHATVMGGGNVIAVAEPLTVTLGALLRFSDQSTALAAHSQE